MTNGLLPMAIDNCIAISPGLQRDEHLVPRVSIIIPVFNRDELIVRCVQSVQAQTLTDLEIIVVDDASTDRTAQVVASLAARDPRIRLVRCERNIGPGMARNRGIASSSGAWVALLDSDDEYHPDRLRCLLETAETTQADMVADNLWLCTDNDEFGPRTHVAAFRAARHDSDQRRGVCPPEHPVRERKKRPSYRVWVSQTFDSKRLPDDLRYPLRRHPIFRRLSAVSSVPDGRSPMDHHSIAALSIHHHR